MDLSRHVHGYEICWKDILLNAPARYLPSVLGYILEQLAPVSHFWDWSPLLFTVSALLTLVWYLHM